MNGESQPKRVYGVVLGLLLLAVMTLIMAGAELTARYLEPKMQGDELTHLDDPRLGWLPKPGEYKLSSSEFTVSVAINSLNMNDREPTSSDMHVANRILALGDSHTFAVGASTQETWPKRLESRLFPNDTIGIVWNAAVIGYSVGQYLERFRGLKDKLRPTLALVGFDTATDLYDLMPPERGGFVYGEDLGRVYFDIGPRGDLLEKVHVSNPAISSERPKDLSLQIRGFLEKLSLYRRLKRSELAMWIAVHRPGGVSLWPGLDTALKKELTEDDKYRWLLAELILGKLVNEAGEVGAKVVIIHIPYLAQVYDSTWAASFGTRPDTYDRWAAGRRLAEMCQKIGATYIDTTDAFVAETRRRQRWLHWPADAHPTPEGHELIAEIVADGLVKSGLLVSKGLNTK